MGFTNFPDPSSGIDTQDYAWITQMVKALDEVAASSSNRFYPPTTTLWDGGPIQDAGLTSTTLTDTSKEWAVFQDPDDGDPPAWRKRYVGWSNPGILPDKQPGSYDVVLLKLFDGGQWEWRKMLRIPISDQNLIDNGDGTFSSDVLHFSEIDTTNYPLDYYTHYFIINHNGAFVHDRVPEWPNDFTYEWGNATSTTTTSIIVDKTQRYWKPGEWTGKYVYYLKSGLVRFTQITGTDRDTLGNPRITFSALSVAPDVSIFGILGAANGYWRPTHQPQGQGSLASMPMTIWYRGGEGQNSVYYTRSPDDAIGQTVFSFPNPSFAVPDTSGDDADTRIYDVINQGQAYGSITTDLDLINESQTTLEQPDHAFFLPLHKTFRMWQTALWDSCAGFVPYRSDFYDGYGSFYINRFTPAKLMWYAGVNAAHGTLGSIVSGGIAVDLTFTESIDSSFLPIPVRITTERIENWTFDTDTDAWVDNGPETHEIGKPMVTDQYGLWDGSKLSGPDFSTPDQGQEVWITWGYTRTIPDRVRYLYPKTCFIPDPQDGDDVDAPQIPPTEDNPGNWITRGISTQLLDYSDYGHVANPLEGGGGEVGSVNFVSGMLARYVGDNYDDPTSQFGVSDPKPWLVDYYDHFYTARPTNPNVIDGSNYEITSGVVNVVDDSLQFGDTTQTWWSGVLVGDAGDEAHNGIVSSCTTTTITDSSQTGSHFWDNSTTGRWVGQWFFIIQPGAIDSGGTSGPLHMTTRPCIAYDAATLTFTFPTIVGLDDTYTYTDSDGDSHTDDTGYSFHEPKWEMNRFANSWCELTKKSDQSIVTSNVTYSSNNRVRVDAWSSSYTPVIGDLYVFKKWSQGVILKWNGSAWVKPTGTDTRYSRTFPDRLWTIPPTHHKKYGRLMNNDYIGIHFMEEVHSVREQLRMKIYNVCFTSDPDDSMVTNNNATFFRDIEGGGDPEMDDPFSQPTCHPTANSTNNISSIHGERSMGYAQLDLSSEMALTGVDRLRIGIEGKFLTYCQILPDIVPDDSGLTEESDQVNPDDGEIIDNTQYIFDTNGDTVLFRAWASWDEFSVTTDLHITSALFGSLDEPDEPPTPDGMPVAFVYQGYTVRQAIVITDTGNQCEFI